MEPQTRTKRDLFICGTMKRGVSMLGVTSAFQMLHDQQLNAPLVYPSQQMRSHFAIPSWKYSYRRCHLFILRTSSQRACLQGRLSAFSHFDHCRLPVIPQIPEMMLTSLALDWFAALDAQSRSNAACTLSALAFLGSRSIYMHRHKNCDPLRNRL